MRRGVDGALEEGTQVGTFTIRRIIGRGGFGITYAAENRLGLKAAIKEFQPDQVALGDSADPEAEAERRRIRAWALRKFEETTVALARFDHPNIVKVRDYIPGEGTGFMFMDLVEGEPFSKTLRKRPAMTLGELGQFLGPIARALGYLHERGIIHRDVKPDNIMVDHAGKPVLIDFGSIKAIETSMTRTANDKGLMAGATVVETYIVFSPEFAAPEQRVFEAELTPTTDIYALAAVAYRALTGEAVPDADRRASSIAAGRTDPYRGIRRVWPPDRTDVTDAAVATIDAALALNPANRPQTMADFVTGMGWDQADAGSGLRPDAAGLFPVPGGWAPGPATGQPAATGQPLAVRSFGAVQAEMSPPVTAHPVTAPPVTAPPVTTHPVTAPPVTAPPVTAPPVTGLPPTAPVTAGSTPFVNANIEPEAPPRRRPLLWLALGLLVFASGMLGSGVLLKQHSEAEARRFAERLADVRYDRPRLQEFLAECGFFCPAELREAAQHRLAVAAAEADRFGAISDDRAQLLAYERDCVSCEFRTAARERIEALERTQREDAQRRRDELTRQEQAAWNAARGDAARLRVYINTCQVCEFRRAAADDLQTLERNETRRREAATFQQARGDLARLRAYLADCTICDDRAQANQEIAGLDAARLRTERKEREDSSFAASRGDLARLKEYLSSCEFCTHGEAARTEVAQLEREAALFNFRVCNQTQGRVSVATFGRRDPNGSWIAQGWFPVAAGACSEIGRWARGEFYYMAVVYGNYSRGWRGTARNVCVRHERFERVNTANYVCRSGEHLEGFNRLNVSAATFTMNLDP